MKYDMWITINGKTDSRSIWERVKHLKVSVTDIGYVTYIHGTVTAEVAYQVMEICKDYEYEVELKRAKGG